MARRSSVGSSIGDLDRRHRNCRLKTCYAAVAHNTEEPPHGNEWRDIREDSRAGISTLSARIGRRWAHYGYVALVLGAYIVLALSVIAGVLPA